MNEREINANSHFVRELTGFSQQENRIDNLLIKAVHNLSHLDVYWDEGMSSPKGRRLEPDHGRNVGIFRKMTTFSSINQHKKV